MTETAQPSELDVGTIVADTYEVAGQLGRGGMGAVWEAHHRRLPGKKVAIKVLHAEVAGDRESLVRFKREAEIASRLGHPNIVEVHDFNTLPSGAPYLVLELLEGESLDVRIRRGPLPLDEAASIVRQIGSALRAAHREDVVHRDLKPQNVFLARSGDGAEVAKVLDFGISKIRGSQTVKTQESSMLGTPQYMSPEQALGNHAAVDARTDVFSLGAIVYEMLCGAPAFPGQNIPEVVFKVVYQDPDPLADKVPSLPAAACEAVHRALAKKQDDRFADVEAFVEALTGSPLGGGQRAAVGDPAPRAQGEDALAATVDSGNRSQVLGTDETVASGSMPRAGAGESKETAAAVSPGAAAGEASPPQAPSQAVKTERVRARRSPIQIAIIAAVVSGVGAALAVGLMMRPGDGGGESEAVASAGASEDELVPAAGPGPADAGQAAAAGDDARTAARVEGELADAAISEREDDPSEPPPRRRAGDRAGGTGGGDEPAPDRDALPPEVERELAAALAALRAEDHARAIQLVERVERKRRTARGAAIKTRAYCAQHDLGNARASWRALPRRHRARVARFCARYDIHL